MQRDRRIYIALLSVFMMLFATQAAFGQSAKQKQLEQRREALKREMRQLQRLRETNKKKEISILTQVEDLDTQIRLRSDLIRVTNSQANLLSREINENLVKMENSMRRRSRPRATASIAAAWPSALVQHAWRRTTRARST